MFVLKSVWDKSGENIRFEGIKIWCTYISYVRNILVNTTPSSVIYQQCSNWFLHFVNGKIRLFDYASLYISFVYIRHCVLLEISWMIECNRIQLVKVSTMQNFVVFLAVELDDSFASDGSDKGDFYISIRSWY